MKLLDISLLSAILIITGLSSCGTLDNTKESSENYCQDLSVKKPEVETTNSFHIDKMEIEGNCLVLTGYTSGCSEGSSVLYWNNITTRSMPPQTQLELIVYEGGLCDMIIEKQWRFNLDDLKLDDVVIKLVDSDLQVRYKN